MSTTPKLEDIIERAVQEGLYDANFCCPAVVTNYDASKRKARVKPQVNRTYNGEPLEMPEIDSVPVIFPSGGGATLSMPLKVGDTVLVVFSDRSIEEWSQNGILSTPKDRRSHAVSDAFCIPGLYSFKEVDAVDANDVVLSYGGTEMRITASGDWIVKAGASELKVVQNGAITLSASKIAAGSQVAEMVDILQQALQALGRATTPLAPSGAAPLSEVATFNQLAARIGTIKA